MKTLLRSVLVLSLFSSTRAEAATLSEVWTTHGLSNPESAYWDADSDQIVISQMAAFGPDGGTDGKLSLMSASGRMINANWVTGLVDPKGMAARNGLLYVADAAGLMIVDIGSGTVIDTVQLPGAVLINDVAITADGTVLVTDLGDNSVFRIRNGAVDYLIRPGEISLPNGIMAHGDTVIVGSFGEGPLSQTFTVETPGGLLAVNPSTGKAAAVPATIGQASVDGIATLQGWVVFADNPTGRLLGLKDDALTVLAHGAPGISDLGATSDLIIVPNSMNGTMTAYRMDQEALLD